MSDITVNFNEGYTYRDYHIALGEMFKYHKFFTEDESRYTFTVGNCYIVMENGQIYIGENNGK